MSKAKLTLNSYRYSYQDVYLLTHPTFRIYLLGTNHFSRLSRNAVRNLIAEINPHCVATELCLRRLDMANMLTDGDPGFRKEYQILATVPKYHRKRAAIELLRLRLIHQALEYVASEQKNRPTRPNPRGYKVSTIKVDDMVLGEDLFAPFKDRIWRVTTTDPHPLLSNSETDYKILLIDQPSELTYEKIATALTAQDVHIVRKYRKNFVKIFLNSGLSGLMQRIWSSNWRISKAHGPEREKFLAYALLRATKYRFNNKLDENEPVRVVGLVGRKHVSPILEIWESARVKKFLIDHKITKYSI